MKYIQTWEVTRRGTPHVNVLISNEWLYWKVRSDKREFVRGWLRPAAIACGFGKECFVKPVYNKKGMVGYLNKLANELTGASVKDQVPINAPRGFRRLRASQKLLPPRTKNPSYTGRIVQCSLTEVIDSVKWTPGGISQWEEYRITKGGDECLQPSLPLLS